MESKQRNLLLVEDDPNLGSVLSEYLQFKGFSLDLSTDGDDAWHKFRKSPYDLLLLDVMLPKLDGFNLAKKIRKEDQDVPIIFLTAKSMKEDKIEGFNAGADDYLTKPFSMEELLLRINAVLKRCEGKSPSKPEDEIYKVGKFTFDYTKQILSNGEKDQKMTTKESDLLRLLCRNLNQTLTREEALTRIWGDDNYFTARSMDVFITKLRKYLKGDNSIKIMNIHGSGYKLVI